MPSLTKNKYVFPLIIVLVMYFLARSLRKKLQQCHADDTALLAGNEKELSELTSKINEVGKQFGMKINIKKTKRKKPKINIAIDGQHIRQVTSFMYPGSLITEEGRSEKDIKRRKMIAALSEC